MATDIHTPPSPDSMPRRPGEKRQLTVLFADLVDSTEMMEALGPEAYDDRLRLFHAICTEAVRQRGGTIAQYQGDGVIANFGHPRAAEDDAARGIAAALDVVAGLARDGGGLRSRIGVATGPVLLRGEGDAFGESAVGACVVRAARLEALAPENAVLICSTTRKLVGDLFEVTKLPDVELKGFGRREAVHRVKGRRIGVRSRFEALRGAHVLPLVGREAELDRLLDRARSARAGRGAAVAISADPGFGKSRLVAALREHPESAALRFFVLQCAPEHAATALHPVREYLEWVAGVSRGDGLAARHGKLKRLIEQVWRASEEETGWLLDELSPLGSGQTDEALSVPLRRRRAFATLARMMLGQANGREALVCVFEDAQWIDPSTAGFVQMLSAMAADLPLLVLVTTRPEPPFGEGAPGLELMRLDRLGASASGALARAAVPGALPSSMLALVLDKADGVPLFIEEFADTLSEAVAAGRRPEDIELPPTIGGLIQGRFDRLDPAVRRFSQAAAALGRQVDGRVAAAVAELDPPAAAAAIGSLEAARLVRRNGSDLSLEFGHALFRDAIYGTLDGVRRRALHGRIADHYLGESATPMPDALLAGHLSRAGRAGPAIDRWRRAALSSAGAGAVFEALTHLENALRTAEDLPAGEARDQQEFSLRAIQGPVLMVTGGPGSPAFGATQARAMELMEGRPPEAELMPVIYNWALHHWARGQYPEALDIARQLDQAARRSDEDAPRLAAHTMRGLVSWHMGRNTDAAESLTGTVRLYDAERHRDLYALYLMEFGVFGHFYLGLAETVLGRPAEGMRHAATAIEIAERVRRPHAMGFALMANVMMALLRDDPDSAADWSARGLDFAAAQGFPEFVAMSRFVAGWAAGRQGRFGEALSQMEEGSGGWDATGFVTWRPIMAARQAGVLVDAGELAAAERLLGRSEDRVVADREAQAAAPLHLTRARLRAAQGDAAAARAEARSAAAIARSQSARLWLDQIEASGLLDPDADPS